MEYAARDRRWCQGNLQLMAAFPMPNVLATAYHPNNLQAYEVRRYRFGADRIETLNMLDTI